MIAQFALGGVIFFLSILVAAISWWLLEGIIFRLHPWTLRPPHGRKLIVVLTLSLIWTLGMMSVAVWLWALTLYFLGIFASVEASVYFSLVAFTTLGFGDILLPTEWRLLGGMAAANGLLLFGLMTAIFVEVLRDTRRRQRKRAED